MTESMMAGVIRRWGGPEVMEYAAVDRPAPKPGQVLVRVEACSLNHLDILVRRGLPGRDLTLPHVAGGDVAGVVEAGPGPEGADLVGRRVLLQPIGEAGILGERYWGGLAEYVVAPVRNAIPLPDVDGVGVRRYAALPMAYGTAYRMLYARAAIRAGEVILVLGATGGVGVACVQFAHLVGADVIACSTSDVKLARMRELGADETINVARENLVARVREITGHGADVVVDHQGGNGWSESLRCARPGGRVVTCGATAGHEVSTNLRQVWTRELSILGSNGWRAGDLEELVSLVAIGHLGPVIHGVFPLSRVAAAVAELEERRSVGKVIVVPDAVLSA